MILLRERKENEIAETGRILGVDRAVIHINHSQAKKRLAIEKVAERSKQ